MQLDMLRNGRKPGLQERCIPVAERARWKYAKLHVLALGAMFTVLSQEAHSLDVKVGCPFKGAHEHSRVLSLTACQSVYAENSQPRANLRDWHREGGHSQSGRLARRDTLAHR